MKKSLPSSSSSSSSPSGSASLQSRRGKKRPRWDSQLSRQSNEPCVVKEDQGDRHVQQDSLLRRPRPQKIIVVGAGVSGLACSRELRQRGYEVLVLEARSRVGGRLKGEVLELGADYPCTLPTTPLDTLMLGKKQQKQTRKKKTKALAASSDANSDYPTTRQHPVDVGGALIHGIENNPIHHITSRMGVPTHAVSSDCLLMNEDGWPFDSKVEEKSDNFFNECLDVTFALAEKDRNSKESFGVLFERVCRQKSGNTIKRENGHGTNGRSLGTKNGCKPFAKDWETPLLKWHRANLELPTGASFYDLGHTWNDDEPYGFDGDHAAVEPSWKLVMERLADGLDILDNAPVTEIRLVLPNGTTPMEIPKATKPDEIVSSTAVDIDSQGKTDKSIATAVTTGDKNGKTKSLEPAIQEGAKEEPVTGDKNGKTKSLEPAIQEGAKEEPVREAAESEPKLLLPPAPPVRNFVKRTRKAKKAFGASVDAAENRRFSRRTRNIGIDVRRSSRSTKGLIKRLEFDKGWDDKNRRKRRKRITTNANAKGTKSKKLDDNGEKQRKESKREEIVDYAPSSVVQVTLQDGSVLEADALVCTLPLGVLKLTQKDSSHVRFVPSLCPLKKDAIENLGCGLLNKCALSFQNVFWQDSDFLGQAKSHYSYLVLNAMKYTQKPILIFMYGGDFARDVETWTDREIVSDCLEVLKKMCGTREIPAPVDYCITRWGKEEYSRMAFTCIPPGVDGAKTLMDMSQPVCDPALPEKPLIMFAGEHTTPYHPSTMHGAFLSGIREAYRFDLYMEPSLNNHTSFDENIHVYKHTFPTKRVYKRTSAKLNTSKVAGVTTESKSENIVTSVNKNRTASSNGKNHSRRRGFGGMTLRNRQEVNSTFATADDTAADGTASVMTTSSSRKNGIMNGTATKIATRWSQRSVGSVRNSILGSPSLGSREIPSVEDILDEGGRAGILKSENKARADKQEERTLLRALESYGSESLSLVRSHILPVYGSTRRRSSKHISNRWKQWREDASGNITNKKGPSAAELMESWKAGYVVSDNWDTHLARIAVDAVKEASASNKIADSSKASRRSLRGSKRRSFFDC